MKRVSINAITDIGCLITFIPSLITRLVLYLVLPEGGGRGSGWATYRCFWQPVGHDAHLHEPRVRCFAYHPPAPAGEVFFRTIRRCLSTEEKKTCDVE